MSEEKDNIIKEKVNETKSGIKAASKAATGDYIGAAKEALKNGNFKKKLKKKIIKIILMGSIPMILAASIFSIYNGMKDEMINLIASAFSTTKGFFSTLWKNITNDYWIKLEDTEKTYVIDTHTGKTIAYVEDGKKYVTNNDYLKDLVQKKWPDGNKTVNNLTKEEIATLTSEYLRGKDTITKRYNLVDSYVKELGDQGISIEDLRLIDEVDYGVDFLNDASKKVQVEKYISEFLRADIITQNFHKRHGDDRLLVNPLNQNHIDGGIYLYRTKSENVVNLTTNDFAGNSYHKREETNETEYVRMEYTTKEDFDAKVAMNDINAKYFFTLDEENENLIVAEITTKQDEYEFPSADSEWFEGTENEPLASEFILGAAQVEVTEKRIPYKEYISKYAMPYEFLINLCQITQNPEFVYHVALLARNTDIALVIQDNITIDKVSKETYTETSYFRNGSSSSTAGASQSLHSKYKNRITTTTTTATPQLMIEYADTWSFYDEFKHVIDINGSITDQGPTDITPSLPSTLPVHHPEEKDENGNVTKSEYWDNRGHEHDFITKRLEMTREIKVESTYEEIQANSVEKSKQFLGLLRNDTGECPHDCYELPSLISNPEAQKCADEAKFNKDGKNVQYSIPGQSDKEAPLNKLTSGLQMLYSIMQSNSSGYRKTDKLLSDESLYQEYYSANGVLNSDGRTSYVVKMQGIIEHLRYLMTYPPNESYTKKWGLVGSNRTEYRWTNPWIDDNIGDVGDEDEIALSKEEIAWKIWCAVIKAGYSEEAAAGVLGSIEAESGFNPEAFNSGGGGIGAYGLAQWRSDRQRRLKNYAGSETVPTAIQIRYLVGEISGSGDCNSQSQRMRAYMDEYNKWMSSSSPEDAATYFARWFERPGKTVSAVKSFTSTKRQQAARKWYDLFHGKDVNSSNPVVGGGRNPELPDEYEGIRKPGRRDEDDPEMQNTANAQIAAKAAEYMRILQAKNYTYGYPSPWPPTTNNGKIDCSGYVSWVLKDLGFVDSRWTSATYKSNPKNWRKIYDKLQVKAGDILVYSEGHVDICAADVSNTSTIVKYNAGSTNGIKKSPAVSKWRSDFMFALRITY